MDDVRAAVPRLSSEKDRKGYVELWVQQRRCVVFLDEEVLREPREEALHTSQLLQCLLCGDIVQQFLMRAEAADIPAVLGDALEARGVDVEVVLRPLDPLCVRSLGHGVVVLCHIRGRKAQHRCRDGHAQALGEPPRHVGFAVHRRLDHFVVLHNDANLRVARALHGPVVDVRRPNNDKAVVDDHELGVDVDLLRRGVAVGGQLAPVAEREEVDVL
mmetsp:Transcript_11682/g.47199  ORF Transcript_11682/g.47199 Transcript_11682/m.47199 type:complete len:216 (-) Transcript_11682:464-1111(-)